MVTYGYLESKQGGLIAVCKTICGLDCSECGLRNECGGCVETNGHPFGGSCMIAACCEKKGCNHCKKCADSVCGLKEQLIAEFNALGIEDMEEVTSLNALRGSFVNLEYTLASGQSIKFWDDNRIYLGNQMCRKNSNRCYGLTADEHYLLVCEYGDNGSDPKIIVYRKRKSST